MSTGYLKVQVHTGDDALPLSGAQITVSQLNGRVLYRARTDESGYAGPFSLPAPDKKYTLDPYYRRLPYAMCHVDIEADGFVKLHIDGVPIVDEETTILTENLQPLAEERMTVTDAYIDLPPLNVNAQEPNRQAEPPPPAASDPEESGSTVVPLLPRAQAQPRAARGSVIIPEYMTVHLGTPTNAAARNVRVRFADYIKNVVSREIYPTWPDNSLRANIHAIVTFALNRIYTEWYRSRGYAFDITNSTAYDMAFTDGGPVFENISRLVDEYFSVYARRTGFENPFFTQFCNGSTVTCPGLSQWGTVQLANQGNLPLQILRYYYPRDLELTNAEHIGGVTESFPGYALRVGSQGEPVRRMQDMLNRIRVNYPSIPLISNPNGTFGTDTEQSVRAFQRIFQMAADGIIGRETWNKINFIFVAVTRLAELDSEGIRITIGAAPPNVVLSSGSRGADVIELQFLLNYLSPYYPSIPPAIQDGVFSAQTKASVIEMQKTFGLTPDGIVGPTTWNKLYAVYKGIQDNVPKPPVTPPPTTQAPEYPGTPLRLGSTGSAVRTMQAYLNTIRTVYPGIPLLTVDGVFGEQTLAAVRAFQQQAFLTVDGIIGPETWNKIIAAFLLVTGEESVSLEYPGTPLRVGSRGASVRLMQTFLSDLRTPYPSLPAIAIDGIFGPNTEAAVLFFQRLFGLVQDGIIGPVTWNAIVQQRQAAV